MLAEESEFSSFAGTHSCLILLENCGYNCVVLFVAGTNLSAVVNKIMKGQFAPITDNYSAEFKALVLDMLQKETQ